MQRLILLVFAVLQTACATDRLIRDKSYQRSMEAYSRGEIEDAQKHFPTGENGGFITSVEKSWLGLWSGHWDANSLVKQEATFDHRKFISISREAGYFLMQEAEEGYIPSEHEVVVLHLLGATHFQQKGQMEEARVELRQAGYVLDRIWDDPALRVWLGTLWAGLGNWNEAQVDFRRAYKLAPSPQLQALLSVQRAPADLTLNFYGAAPTLNWVEGHYTPTIEGGPKPAGRFALPSQPWFDRHTQRNTDLRDMVVKSNFMAQYLGGKVTTGAERGLNFTVTSAIRAAAIVFGVVVVGGTLYLASQAAGSATSGDSVAYMVGLGFTGAYGIWAYGGRVEKELERGVTERDQRKQEDLRVYRMVRFLPEWIGVEAGNPASQDLHTLRTALKPASPEATRVTLVNWIGMAK